VPWCFHYTGCVFIAAHAGIAASPRIIATPHRQRFMRLLRKKKGTEGIKP
jgi:hypothetical protein